MAEKTVLCIYCAKPKQVDINYSLDHYKHKACEERADIGQAIAEESHA